MEVGTAQNTNPNNFFVDSALRSSLDFFESFTPDNQYACETNREKGNSMHVRRIGRKELKEEERNSARAFGKALTNLLEDVQ